MKPGKWVPKIVMAAFFVGALLYFASYAIQTFRSEITTTAIHTATVEDSVEASGITIRKEQPLERTEELMEVLPAEGETVAKGETLALVYEDKEALQQHQKLEQKTAERDALQYVLSHSAESSDTVELSKSIISSIESIRSTIFQEDLTKLGGEIQSLENMIYRQDYTYKGSETVTKELNALNKQVKKLEQSSDAVVSQVKAETAGTFSTMVDGYETVLTPKELSGLTPSKLETLKKQQKEVKNGSYLGKIITGKKWYFAASMAEDDVERMQVGLAVTVRFDDVAGDQAMTVYSISDPEDGKVTVVFSSNSHLNDTSLLRAQSVSVIYDSCNGFRIPKEALRMDGDTYYVYRLSGMQIHQAVVQILAETDDYFVVGQSESKDEKGNAVEQSELEKAKQLREGDTIVIRGTDLYDGKVIEQ